MIAMAFGLHTYMLIGPVLWETAGHAVDPTSGFFRPAVIPYPVPTMSSSDGKSPTQIAGFASSSLEYEEYRQSILSKFSVEDEKRVLRKVDRKFLLLIGVLYLIKNVLRMWETLPKVHR
jgi:hypothetical protein